MVSTPRSFRSAVWEHYPVENGDGNRVIDKTHTICRKCFKKLPQVTGNTSNMLMHLQRHHPDIHLSGAWRKTPQGRGVNPGGDRGDMFPLE